MVSLWDPISKKETSTPRRKETQTKPRIDFIMGGSTFCMESVNSIKAHQRQLRNYVPHQIVPDDQEVSMIILKDNEAKGLVTTHDDALVIKKDISNFAVARILIII